MRASAAGACRRACTVHPVCYYTATQFPSCYCLEARSENSWDETFLSVVWRKFHVCRSNERVQEVRACSCDVRTLQFKFKIMFKMFETLILLRIVVTLRLLHQPGRPSRQNKSQKRQNFIFLTVHSSISLLLQRCAYTLVWFRHKILLLGFRKQNISHLNICFGPEDSIKTPSFAATNTAEYSCISNGFTIKNVKTQTRTVVTGLAASSPVTHMFCDRDICNTLSINVTVVPRVPFCSAEFKHVQVF